jgi:hypothetical protein
MSWKITPAKHVKRQINARAFNFLTRWGCMWENYTVGKSLCGNVEAFVLLEK